MVLWYILSQRRFIREGLFLEDVCYDIITLYTLILILLFPCSNRMTFSNISIFFLYYVYDMNIGISTVCSSYRNIGYEILAMYIPPYC